MPELPEVETVRRGLELGATGKKIAKVDVLHSRATKANSLLNLKSLEGKDIEKVLRRGKFLWFKLGSSDFLVAHLGMTGVFKFAEVGDSDERHLRVRATLSDEAGHKSELRFIDPRTFGWLAVDGGGLEPALVARVGRDVFDPLFDKEAVVKSYLSRGAQIKTLLLDQKIMSGVGNIYADEALWLAKIHPERAASGISRKKMGLLIDSAKEVMLKSLDKGGTTFDGMYTDVKGEKGYFMKDLNVYGRGGGKCYRCKSVIKRIPFMGRSSHFCPKCQVR